MACTDCFENCFDKRTTDRCVQYTGDDIPLLGICNGDSLYQVEVIILEKLQEALDGTGIVLSDVTLENCPELLTIFGTQEKTLVNLIQMLIDYQCTLKSLIDALTPSPVSFDTACLTGLPTNPTATDILQAAVTKLCSVSTDVAAIKADYVKSSQLCSMVNACLSGTSSTQEYTKMPKYVPMAYLGPLSVFDSTGKGIDTLGYDKVYICNGNNGTQDLRGRTLVGANTNVVGPSLASAVDPSQPQNAGYNFAQNTQKGAYTDTLTTNTIPAHSHSITDPGHTHNVQYSHGEADQNESGTYGDLMDRSGSRTSSATTTSDVTGILINSTGSGQPHNNTQPSHGVVWIMYIP